MRKPSWFSSEFSATRSAVLFAVSLALILSSTAAPCQQLTVQPDTGKPVVFSRSDLEELPTVDVTTADHSGTAVKFTGVSLESVLEKAGVTFGESLKGKRLASCLSVEAADGYRAVIALPELTQPSRTNRFSSCFNVMEGLWTKKKGPIASSFPMKSEWPVG